MTHRKLQRLQRVMVVREKLASGAERTFLRAQLERTVAETAVMHAIKSWMASALAPAIERTTVAELTAEGEHVASLARDIDRAKAALAQRQSVENLARGKLEHAQIALRRVEKLHERLEERTEESARSLAANAMDELAARSRKRP